MHITPFKACLPILEKIPAAAAFFDEAKFSFSDFFTQGLLRTTPTENFYVYRITTVKKTATGLIACADVQDYLKGHIKKHEQTIISNEEKQTALMLQNHAVIKPVLLMHDPLLEIVSLYDKIIKTKTPDLDVRIKKTQHQLWAVETGPDERALTSLFAEKINTAYIADGHHRAASTATLYRQNKNLKLFCAFFSSDDLIIRPFHRIITDMNGLSSEKFLKKIFGNFEKKFLTEKKSPRRKNELILFFEKKIFQINFPKKNLKKKFEKIFQEKFSKKFARKDLSKKNFKSLLEFGTSALHTSEKKLSRNYYRAIKVEKRIFHKKVQNHFRKKNFQKNNIKTDTEIFNEKILKNIFGINDVRSSDKIKYIEDHTALNKIIVQCPEQGALFLLNPISIKDFKKIVDANGILPPKSTFFEPRLLNGLISCEV